MKPAALMQRNAASQLMLTEKLAVLKNRMAANTQERSSQARAMTVSCLSPRTGLYHQSDPWQRIPETRTMETPQM